MVWRARKPLPLALRSSAALALGLARQRAPMPEHRLPVRVSACAPNGCSLLFSFLFLCSFCPYVYSVQCSFEVTVTSVLLPSFVSHRGLFQYKPRSLSNRPSFPLKTRPTHFPSLTLNPDNPSLSVTHNELLWQCFVSCNAAS